MYKAHLFICTNGGPDKEGTCGHKGSIELHQQVKAMCKQAPFNPEVRVNKSGCLGYCARGISAVMYPQNEWYFQQSKNSADFLFNEVKKRFD
jgi:predicted metal-binding protein